MPTASASSPGAACPTETGIIEYRERAMAEVRKGKTHIVINCQTLEVPHFNLVEILADLEAALADTPDARIDVIHLAQKLLPALLEGRPPAGGRALPRAGPDGAGVASGVTA